MLTRLKLLFTLADLREVYEAILGRRLDPANFRRQVDSSETLIPSSSAASCTRTFCSGVTRSLIDSDRLARGLSLAAVRASTAFFSLVAVGVRGIDSCLNLD